jgi:hypothetical protein
VKWTKSQDGRPRTEVRVIHRVSREDMAALLILGIGTSRFRRVPPGVAIQGDDGRLITGQLPRAVIWQHIRGQLTFNADKANWWQDEFTGSGPDEPDPDDIWDWALRQVSVL